MPKLTKRLIDAAEVRAVEYFIWDDDIPGFGLRILPSGRKGYVTQYRAGRRPRRMSLGPSTVLTCEQARKRAITIVAAVRNGEDPAEQRDAGRKVITVGELAERFDKEHISVRLKASTAKEYRRNLRRFILPALGRLTVTDITRADVAKFHHDLRHITNEVLSNIDEFGEEEVEEFEETISMEPKQDRTTLRSNPDLPWKKWSTLIERIRLIQTLIEGGKNEPQKAPGTDYQQAA